MARSLSFKAFSGFLGVVAVLALAAPAWAQSTPSNWSDLSADPFLPIISTQAEAPLLPWIPQEHMYDRPDAARYWNLRYRGGRLQVGLSTDLLMYETVAAASLPQVNGMPDPEVHAADVYENHINLHLGIVVYENIRLQLGVGASLGNFRRNSDHPLNPVREEYDRYGWGFNYRVELGFAPILVFMPEFILPEITVEWRQWVGKNIAGLGRMENGMLRADVIFNFELIAAPGEYDASFLLFIGIGYNHLFGDLNGKEFSPRGSGTVFGNFDLIGGFALTIDRTWLIRGKAHLGTMTFSLGVELIAD